MSGSDSMDRMVSDISAMVDRLIEAYANADGKDRTHLARSLNEIAGKIGAAAKKAEESSVRESKTTSYSEVPDDFWNLVSSSKKYSPPGFGPEGIGTESVTDSRPAGPRPVASALKIPPRDAAPARDPVPAAPYETPDRLITKIEDDGSVPSPEGAQIPKYVLASHRTLPKVPYTSDMDPVPFKSFFPELSKMNSSQLDFYFWFRENVRHGRYVEADLAYILTYIYEIIDLRDSVPAEKGAEILCGIWLAYRKKYPFLDTILADCVTDYCITRGTDLPGSVTEILPYITPKAVFKEYYIDILYRRALDGTPGDLSLFGQCVCETLSDYDYRNSKTYETESEYYDEYLPYAVGTAVMEGIRRGTEPFDCSKIYTAPRKCFSNAVVSPGAKKTVRISFRSFSRSASVRTYVTEIVRYAENVIRVMLKLRSKTPATMLGAVYTDAVDRVLGYSRRTSEEPEYMRFYDSADQGLSIASAGEIEHMAWQNTERLTGGAYSGEDDGIPGEDGEPVPYISTETITAEDPVDASPDGAAEVITGAPAAEDAWLRDALGAAMEGRFREYCRENSRYIGETADRINSIFIDRIGDVVLEIDPDGNGCAFIEDYREEAEEWLREP